MSSCALVEATAADLEALMSWFPTAEDVNVWGGPRFRFPFTPETFIEDCHWPAMLTFVLRDATEMLAFGQLYERHQRINLARLVVNPNRRGEGLGRRLVEALLDEGTQHFDCREYSLFVYRDNTTALRCYEGCGFRVTDYPKDAGMADICFYLTRPVNRRNDHAP